MAEVKFPAYRNYIAARQDANNAMIALLAGARLAAHTLQLTVGSTSLLPQIFPAIPQIRHFNLQTVAARQLLLDADSHLGAVAVPYALAVHEDYVMSCLGLLKSVGIKLRTSKQAIRAWNMHEVLFNTTGTAIPIDLLGQYHLLRHMRNSQIHEGGSISIALASAITAMTDVEKARWRGLTGRPPEEIDRNGKLSFVSGDLIAAFAVTKKMGREINAALQTGITREDWSRIAALDFSPQAKFWANSDQWLRSLQGYARTYYGSLSLSDSELETAARDLGLWTRSSPVAPRRAKKKKGGSSC